MEPWENRIILFRRVPLWVPREVTYAFGFAGTLYYTMDDKVFDKLIFGIEELAQEVRKTIDRNPTHFPDEKDLYTKYKIITSSWSFRFLDHEHWHKTAGFSRPGPPVCYIELREEDPDEYDVFWSYFLKLSQR